MEFFVKISGEILKNTAFGAMTYASAGGDTSEISNIFLYYFFALE